MQSITIMAASVVGAGLWADEAYFLELPAPPDANGFGEANAVSADGRFVAGWYATSLNPFAELMRWSDHGPDGATVEALGVLAWGQRGMKPVAISADGSVIAGTALEGMFNPQPVATRWADPGTGGPGYSKLGVLDGPYPVESAAGFGMSDDGSVIVGASFSVDPNKGLSFTQPFRWELTDADTGEGVIAPLPLLPGYEQGYATGVSSDGQVIVGWVGTNQAPIAVRWVGGEVLALGELEPGGTSFAKAVSADGSIIMGLASLDGANVPFRWTASDGMQAVQAPPQGVGRPDSVANSGLAVGLVYGQEGAVWTPAGEAYPVSQWLLAEHGLDTSGWTLTPQGIAPDGRTIVGPGVAPDFHYGAWVTHLGPACPADVNGDGNLNILDFVAFQLLWQSADPGADCDANADFNVLDFVCFQQLFVQGCE